MLKERKVLCIVFSLICLIILSIPYAFADNNALPSNDTNAAKVVKIPPPIEGTEKTVLEVDQPQKLDIEDIKVITSSGEKYVFHVELAKTLTQKKKGLMYRDQVKPFTGMLFLFQDNRERSFWMKNTLIPLDLIFIKRDGIIHHIYSNAVPESLARIKSNGDVSAVLELAGGEAERLSISIGDRITHDFFSSETSQ